MLPFRTAEFEDVVVNVEGQRDVKVVGADGGVGPLCFCSLEVKETYLVPQQGTHVALERS